MHAFVSKRPIALILSIIILAGGLCRLAAAQETYGMLSGPIASPDFNRSIERLDLTWEQRIAAEAAHERYKEHWRRLRDHEVLPFTKAMRDMSQSGQAFPGLDQIRDILDRRRTIRTQTNRLEKTLFDELGEIVTPDQQAMFERTQLLRERTRYESSMLAGMVDSNHADLVLLIEDEMNVAPEIRAMIEEPLRQYERSVTVAMRSLDVEITKMLDELLDRLDKLGIDDVADDPEATQALMMEFGMAMQEAAEDARKVADDVESIDKRSAEQIRLLLPPNEAAKFNRRFLARVYPEVYSDGGTPEDLIERAIGSDEVSEDEKAQIASIHSTWQTQYESKCREMLDMHQKFTESQEKMQFDQAFDWQTYWEKMELMRTERTALNAQTTERINELLGEERAMRVASRSVETDGSDSMSMEIVVEGATAVALATGEAVFDSEMFVAGSHSYDFAVPGRISENELLFYLDRLGLSDDMRAVARGFHETYAERYDRLMEEKYQPLIGEPSARIWGENGADVKAAEEVAAGRRALGSIVVDLESSLFDEIGLLMPDARGDALGAVRTARRCAGFGAAWMADGVARPSVDYAAIVRSLGLSQQELASLESALREFDSRRVPVLTELLDLFIDRQVVDIKAQNLWREAQTSGVEVDYQEVTRRYQEMLAPFEESRAAGVAELTEISEWFLAELRKSLPPGALVDFEMRYARAAYPEVYPDRADATASLQSARDLPDLSGAQAARIDSLTAEHDQQHAAICRDMIDIADQTRTQPQWDQQNMEPFIDWQAKTERMQVLQFDREEWNETTRRALRAALTEEQAARVRALDAS